VTDEEAQAAGVTFSPYIDAIRSWLDSIGVLVQVVDTLPENIAGRYTSGALAHVQIAACASARSALMTLAHEAGHHIGYLLHERREPYKREQQAYVYGWRVLKLVRAPITRDEWRTDCREAERWRMKRRIEQAEREMRISRLLHNPAVTEQIRATMDAAIEREDGGWNSPAVVARLR
jgi:hypothetical protein